MRSTLTGGLIALVLVGTACHKMTVLSWAELGAMRPGTVWVTYSDASVAEVSGPQIFGDTLVGYVSGEFTEIPTGQVQQVTMRESAKGKTIALVVASTAAAAGLAAFMAGSGVFGKSHNTDCYDTPEADECVNGLIYRFR